MAEATEVAPKKAQAKKAPVEEVEVAEDAIVVSPETTRGRVKGTWRMNFAGVTWNFVDGSTYDLPKDLYDYLRGHGNIYDTLA
ncbi:MAG: hypothetical protein CL724_11750 [Chloroflexi bacterium]|jgi:hypothetical protein|nr:hypothetical protein [Chloroflexota bacterium]|tara:strand:+ start:82 stop:330 length:249 start_codon:yes stop_codon:yes gene_type:complete